MKEAKRELVWLPEALAKKVKDLEDKDLQYDIVSKYVDETKLDMKYAVEGIDEDVIVFKASMIRIRAEFKKVVAEQVADMEKLWETHDKKSSDIKKKVETLVADLTPITEELKEIDTLLGKISTYNIDKLIDSFRGLQNLYGKEKEMFQFVVNHFGEKKCK